MRILVVDDESNARYAMVRVLTGPGRELMEAENGVEALDVLSRLPIDLAFLDLNMPGKGGLEVLAELQQCPSPHAPEVIVVTANDSIDQAVECIRRGASDFLTKPYDVEQVRAIARRSQQRVHLEQEAATLRNQLRENKGTAQLLGNSRAMRELITLIDRAALCDLPVLLRGESGTGKELVARQLHDSSPRRAGPFFAINTAAIAESLIESELFGHAKGAFTGADRDREGIFRKAHGGTLFLDEIGDMPATVQTRLLQVLQEQQVQPVGSETSYAIDVRILSATHQDLEVAMESKQFRQDLYYRLRGIELFLPPLRHRPDDIVLLAQQYAKGKSFSKEAMAAMLEYAWPGNVRELKQRVESAVAMTEEETLTPKHLGLGVVRARDSKGAFDSYIELPLTEAKSKLAEDYERFAIEKALELEQGNITAAARRLGIHRQNLQQKLRALGL